MADAIAIYFTEEEQKKIDEAENYSIIKGRMFLNMLLKMGLENIPVSENKMLFEVEMRPIYKKDSTRNRTIRIEHEVREKIDTICSFAPFSRSGLARYLIIPEVDKIIKNKGWKYS